VTLTGRGNPPGRCSSWPRRSARLEEAADVGEEVGHLLGAATALHGLARLGHARQVTVVFLLLAVGTLTQLALARFNSRRVVMTGLGLLLAVFLGSLATANRLAPPGRRSHAISAFFVACYTGLIIPVVGVGVATEFISDFTAVLALSILLAVLCLFSLARIRNSR
jgi:hypothetical protein